MNVGVTDRVRSRGTETTDKCPDIVEVLRETNGIVAGPRGAAVRLGLKRTTLVSKMQKLGITPDRAVSTPAQTGRAVHHR